MRYSILAISVLTVSMILSGCIGIEDRMNNSNLNYNQSLSEPVDVEVSNEHTEIHQISIQIKDLQNVVIFNRTIEVEPGEKQIIQNVTDKNGKYNVTVITDSGLKQEYQWRVDRQYREMIVVVRSNGELFVTQVISDKIPAG